MSLIPIAQLLAGLLLLALGAELLVRGAVRLAARLGLSPLLIGLTLVALLTNAPELAVALRANGQASGDLAVGTVLGSNLANLLLVLGGCAVLRPQWVSRSLALIDAPLLLGAGLLVTYLGSDAHLERVDGAVLLFALFAYLCLLAWRARQPGEHADSRLLAHRPRRWPTAILVILGGLPLLLGGATLMVQGASQLALDLGLSERLIGLTVVALGTSLPEFAISLVAVLRGQREIAIGNVIGSCLFNLLLVLGATALVEPEGLSISPNTLAFDLPAWLAASAGCLLVLLAGRRIGRCEGLLFLVAYAGYLSQLLLVASGMRRLAQLQHLLIWSALPLGLLTLFLLARRLVRRQSAFHPNASTEPTPS